MKWLGFFMIGLLYENFYYYDLMSSVLKYSSEISLW